MYKLKAVAQRGALLTAAAIVAVAAYLPAPSASADALNPLTDRSLTLSSSSPGWSYTDGSGNATYAPPNSGANGQKTGNTFDFKVSTNTTGSGDEVKAITFQYCTTSAGDCMGPGDNGFDGAVGAATRNPNTNSTSDLNVVTSSPAEVSSGNFGTIVNSANGNVQQVVNRNGTEGNYVVYYDNAGTWTQSTGWTMTASEKQIGDVADHESTGANNNITLTNTGGQGFAAGTQVKIVFFGTDTNYITNPGSGAFFVKINTFKDDTTLDDSTLVDGGVTVANVMNHSINIQTKVLETMQFSVGTVDPNTLDDTQLTASDLAKNTHGVCDPILTRFKSTDAEINVLKMGNQIGEDSLEVDKTYSTHSYWRLSSNSSAGATVYYSGVTLSNTVGDEIAPIGPTKAAPAPGGEQFGLAVANETSGNYLVDWNMENDSSKPYENGADMAAAGLQGATPGVHSSTTSDNAGQGAYHAPQLAPLAPTANYNEGAGTVNSNYDSGSDPVSTAFAFDPTSNLIPVPIASNSTQVVDCVTAKMRYAANIAATTPAGIYTTKINYIAAPQY